MARNTPHHARSIPLIPSRVLLTVLIGLCALFVFSYTGRLVRKAQLETSVASWEAQIAGARQKQRVLTAELQEAESDAFIDKIAREDLGLAKESDVEIIVIEPTLTPPSAAPNTEAAPANSANPAGLPRSTMPVWQQWLSLLASE